MGTSRAFCLFLLVTLFVCEASTAVAQISIRRARGEYSYIAPNAAHGFNLGLGPLNITRTANAPTAGQVAIRNNLINTFGDLGQTVIPILPQLINPAGAALGGNGDQAAQAEEAAATAPADAILDTLQDPNVHAARMARLDQTYADTIEVVKSLGLEPVAPFVAPTPTTPPTPPTLVKEDTKRVELTVGKHPAVNLTNAQAQRILDEVSLILQTDDDGPGDADRSLNIAFRLKGNVVNYRGSDAIGGVIFTRGALNRLRSLNDDIDILVVPDLDFCGEQNPNVIGCAIKGRTSVQIVVERQADVRFEAVLWAHELCHNGGAGHRSSQAASLALMSPYVRGENTRINTREFLFLSAIDTTAAAALQPSGGANLAGEAGGMDDPVTLSLLETDINEIVRRSYVEGLPWQELRARYTRYSIDAPAAPEGAVAVPDVKTNADIEAMRVILMDSNQKAWHANAITILCATGHRKGLYYAAEYIKENYEDHSSNVARAVSAGFIYLGRLANEMGAEFPIDASESIESFIASVVQRELIDEDYAAITIPPSASPTEAQLQRERAEAVAFASLAALAFAKSDRYEALRNAVQEKYTPQARPQDSTAGEEAALLQGGLLEHLQYADEIMNR